MLLPNPKVCIEKIFQAYTCTTRSLGLGVALKPLSWVRIPHWSVLFPFVFSLLIIIFYANLDLHTGSLVLPI